MNAYTNKTNGVKLLALVAVLAMVIAGAAVVMSDDGVDAASGDGMDQLGVQPTEGVIDLTGDVTLNQVLEMSTDITTVNGNGYSIIDNTAADHGIDFTYVTGNITFNDVVFETNSTTYGSILNTYTQSGVSVVFNDCTFQANDVRKAVQVYAASGSVTFNNCDFYDSEVVYNDAGTGTLTFTGCNDLTLSVAANTNSDAITIGASGDNNINIDAATTIANLILGWNFGNGWASPVTTAPSVTISTNLEVDEILAGVDSVSSNVPAGAITVNEGSTISAAYSEIEISGDGTAEVSEYDIYVPGGDNVTAESINTTLDSYGTATINSDTTISGEITIDDGQTLYINGCYIYSGDDAKITVNDGGSLITDGAFVYVGVDVKDGATTVANNPHVMTSDGGTTSTMTVGFGDTLNLTGDVSNRAELNVYGTLNTSSLTVSGTVNAYIGSTVNIDGTVGVSGTFNMTDADLNLTGTINVNGTAGAFNLTGTSTVTVAESGTFTVAAGNTLSIAAGSTFTVEGTLEMNGAVSGEIQNKGTVTFNGTVAAGTTARIVMYSGVTLEVASVSGTLTVTDEDDDVVKDYLGRDPISGSEVSSFGNTVTLTNVRGVTVVEEVATYTDTVSGERVRSIIGTMNVSGDVSVATGTTSGTVALANAAETVGDDRAGELTVGDLTVGAGVTLTNASESTVTVVGTVTATAAATTTTGLAAASIRNSGTIDVDGTVAVTNTSGIGTINAVMYSVTTEANSVRTTVYYYTTLSNAIAAGNADEGMLYIVGEVEVDGEQTLTTGTIRVDRGNTLTIPVDASLTIAAGALLDISGTVTVNGVLVIMDNTTGLDGTPVYDVLKTSGVTDTYSGLTYALAHASAGETITLARDVTLNADTVVPEGVTLATGRHTLTVGEDVSLTVNGTVSVQNSGDLVADATGSEVVVNGVIGSTSSKLSLADMKAMVDDGAFFENGNTDYVSNVAYAAENIGNGSVIDIQGDVTTGDVTFAGDPNLTVNVTAGSTFTAGTVTLDGASMNLIGTMTGTVQAADADGTASVDLDNASGFANNALVLESESVQTADGDVNYLYISGKIDNGTVDIASGTVTVNDAAMAVNSTTEGATRNGTLTVSAGATLDIPEGMKLVARPNTDATATVFDVQGTVDVDGTLEITGITSVAGTVNANDGSTVTLDGATSVTGTIAGTTAEGESATITVSDVLTLGTKPTSLGSATDAGTLVGTFTVSDNGYIKAYSGSDVTGARINPTATEAVGADFTEFYVNDELYMTVYADSVTLSTVIGGETFELSGYDCEPLSTAANWKDVDGNAVTNIGDKDAVYATVELSTVGINLSIGPNLTVYIDGIRYTNGQTGVTLPVGTHEILVQINPGLTGTTTVTFNGQAVTGTSIEVTAEMADAGESVLLSVVGDLTQDQPVINVGGGSSDDGMGLTDYLLIILVILIVIMAIMVALRLMRS